ncbi:MAG: YibE/F family protein [Lactobacillaceae bacterium]|jgi:uncharacterized membrane protein|nr:YibE/F family protein [Lactobacillaceae bacterium]
MKNWQKNLLIWSSLIVVVGLTAFFLRHDAQLYQRPIVQIEQVTNAKASKVTDQFGNQVKQTKQTVTAKFLNTKQRHQLVHFTNTYDSSMAMSQPLTKNMQVFISKIDHNTWQVKTMKRDATWVPILVLVLGILMILMGRAGRLTGLALGINTILFTVTIYLNLALGTGFVFWLFVLFSLLAATITLGLVMGFFNPQTWVVLATVITATLLAMGIGKLVFLATNNQGLHMELMSFITQLPEPLFLAMTLVGVLGAVMDESTDMIATLFSLEEEHQHVTTKELIIAGRRVGQEIFGALSNVLFLIFIAAQIPMALLYLRNGNTMTYTYRMNMSLGMVQTLISAIGIVLTVPAGIIWFLIFRRIRQRRQEANK